MLQRVVDRYLAKKVARRFLAEALVTKEIAEDLARRTGLSPITVKKLRTLANDLDLGGLVPFPLSELREYLLERGAPEEEVEELLSKKIRAPRKKTVTWSDAWLTLNREVGKSVIFDGALEHDPNAPASALAWVKAFKALRPKAKATFSKVVRKVSLRRPRGSEDASWESGGVLALAIGKGSLSPAVGAGFITHELGHGVEEAAHVRGSPWGLPPFVSDYAESKPDIEDFAESFRVYIEKPAELKRVSREKFEAMKKIVG